MQTAICLSIPLSIPVHSLFVFLFFFFFSSCSLVLFLHLSRLPNTSTPDRKSNAGPSEISEFLLGLVVGRLSPPPNPPSTRKPWQKKRNISTRARRTTKVIEYSTKCPEYIPTPPIALSCLPLVWIFLLPGRHGTTLAAGSLSTQRNETGASPRSNKLYRYFLMEILQNARFDIASSNNSPPNNLPALQCSSHLRHNFKIVFLIPCPSRDAYPK